VVPDCGDLIAARDARHAYAVLRGLTASTGAMVAAVTTSLPEHLEGGRNYDYRYAWIRDQCYAGLAVAAHGPHPLLDGTIRFITERAMADGPGLMPAYTVAGQPIPDERGLRLRGYPGGTARVGNRVTSQFQLDGLGERWSGPDAGIWELEHRHWTHSCLTGAVHPSGRWQRSPDDGRVDAALLLPVIRGAAPADDPRNRATVRAVQDELTEDGFVYRFRQPADRRRGGPVVDADHGQPGPGWAGVHDRGQPAGRDRVEDRVAVMTDTPAADP
jgi:alpha,alpha-trehalase